MAALDSALDAGGRLLTVAAYDPAWPGNEPSEDEPGTSAPPNGAVGPGHNVPVEVRVLVRGVPATGDSAGVVVIDVGLVRVVVVTGASQGRMWHGKTVRVSVAGLCCYRPPNRVRLVQVVTPAGAAPPGTWRGCRSAASAWRRLAGVKGAES